MARKHKPLPPRHRSRPSAFLPHRNRHPLLPPVYQFRPPAPVPDILPHPASAAPASRVDFFDLPFEIRTRIYDLVIHPTGVVLAKNKRRRDPDQSIELTTSNPRRASRRLLGVPTSQPTELGLLLAARQAYTEVLTLVYSRTTFTVDTPSVITQFMLQCPRAGVESVQKIAIRHAAYGVPRHIHDYKWKRQFDQAWYRALDAVKVQMLALKSVNVTWTTADLPCSLNIWEDWAQPLVNLGTRVLEDAVVTVHHPRLEEKLGKTVAGELMAQAARGLEAQMTGGKKCFPVKKATKILRVIHDPGLSIDRRPAKYTRRTGLESFHQEEPREGYWT